MTSLASVDFSSLDLKSLRAIKAELEQIDAGDALSRYAPYPRQREFHELGKTHRIRGLLGGNQSGKSVCGAAEVAMHLTGIYPESGQAFYPDELHDGSPHPLAGQDAWPQGWQGHRFRRAIRCWAAGLTNAATRDNAQAKLIGPPEIEAEWGTGMIPRRCILEINRSRGIPNAIDSAVIRHTNGGASRLWFKSYEQGRVNWQGPTLDLLWPDEEPPEPIWSEGTTRCAAVPDARILATFTPLMGMSAVLKAMLAGRPMTDFFQRVA